MEIKKEKVSYDTSIFEHALKEQLKNELGSKFANKCLKVLILVVFVLLFSLILNIYLSIKIANPPIKYFATNEGKIIELFPTNEPAFTSDDVINFGTKAIAKSFILDFVHYKQQITDSNIYFSNSGFNDYYNALKNSNILELIKTKKMNMTVSIGAGVITKKGTMNGVYIWVIQYPVSIKLEGQVTSLTDKKFIFQTLIQRADMKKKPNGLEVHQLITTSSKG